VWKGNKLSQHLLSCSNKVIIVTYSLANCNHDLDSRNIIKTSSVNRGDHRFIHGFSQNGNQFTSPRLHKDRMIAFAAGSLSAGR